MKKRTLIIGAGILVTLGLAGCGSSANNSSESSTDIKSTVVSSSQSQYGYKDDELKLHDLTLKITKIELVKPGSQDYNNKWRLAVYYDLTNNTDKDINPLTAASLMSAVQDTNGSQVDNLEVGVNLMKNKDLTDKQSDQIKKGCTAPGCIVYDLTNNTDKVTLNFENNGTKCGSKTIDLSKLEQVEDTEY